MTFFSATPSTVVVVVVVSVPFPDTKYLFLFENIRGMLKKA